MRHLHITHFSLKTIAILLGLIFFGTSAALATDTGIFGGDSIIAKQISRFANLSRETDHTTIATVNFDRFDFNPTLDEVSLDESGEKYNVAYSFTTYKLQNQDWQQVRTSSSFSISRDFFENLGDIDTVQDYLFSEINEIVDAQKTMFEGLQERDTKQRQTTAQLGFFNLDLSRIAGDVNPASESGFTRANKAVMPSATAITPTRQATRARNKFGNSNPINVVKYTHSGGTLTASQVVVVPTEGSPSTEEAATTATTSEVDIDLTQEENLSINLDGETQEETEPTNEEDTQDTQDEDTHQETSASSSDGVVEQTTETTEEESVGGNEDTQNEETTSEEGIAAATTSEVDIDLTQEENLSINLDGETQEETEPTNEEDTQDISDENSNPETPETTEGASEEPVEQTPEVADSAQEESIDLTQEDQIADQSETTINKDTQENTEDTENTEPSETISEETGGVDIDLTQEENLSINLDGETQDDTEPTNEEETQEPENEESTQTETVINDN